jgi:MoaA/NifB/PqqE/SkfB family radical SAM enzyme
MYNFNAHLEISITYACNHTCESCAHFSNHGHNRIISLDEARKWMEYWNKRITPKLFVIMGGEPTLHKDLVSYVYMTRELWPNSKIEIISNGSFLHNYPDLPQAMLDTDTSLQISFHDNSEEFKKRSVKTVKTIKEWKKNHPKLKIHASPVYNYWIQVYKGYGDNMMPYEDNDPDKSWENCFCRQQSFKLHEGNLYKCALLAYLPMQAEKYNLSSKWDHYLTYKPLTPDASDEEIVEFFNRKSESYCGMCSANGPHFFKKKDPLLPVSYWENEM